MQCQVGIINATLFIKVSRVNAIWRLVLLKTLLIYVYLLFRGNSFKFLTITPGCHFSKWSTRCPQDTIFVFFTFSLKFPCLVIIFPRTSVPFLSFLHFSFAFLFVLLFLILCFPSIFLFPSFNTSSSGQT
jgi:hypothetical protein